MASINDLATAASALVAPAAAPHPPLPDSAQAGGGDDGDHAVARGALVVLEGLDRSGKTTQVKLLEQRFVELGRKVKVMRFPGMYCAWLALPCPARPGGCGVRPQKGAGAGGCWTASMRSRQL